MATFRIVAFVLRYHTWDDWARVIDPLCLQTARPAHRHFLGSRHRFGKSRSFRSADIHPNIRHPTVAQLRPPAHRGRLTELSVTRSDFCLMRRRFPYASFFVNRVRTPSNPRSKKIGHHHLLVTPVEIWDERRVALSVAVERSYHLPRTECIPLDPFSL